MLAERRKNKEVKLNKLSSISGGGGISEQVVAVLPIKSVMYVGRRDMGKRTVQSANQKGQGEMKINGSYLNSMLSWGKAEE